MIKSKFALIVFFLLALLDLQAQDLNCRVQIILSPKISAADRRLPVFKTLETAVIEFMNNTKWTDDSFNPEERIEANILITINEVSSVNTFKGSAQVQSSRPIYGTGYNSTLLNHNDNDFDFSYTEYEPLEFSETQSFSNLTSMLAFYAYMIIGFDYDTYSMNGGEPYFQKAQSIANVAQQNQEDGWKPFESTRNRYWMVENVLNPSYKPFRTVLYEYHRLGLDVMQENMEKGREAIMTCIDNLAKVHQEKPGSMVLLLWFTTKSDEISDIFQRAQPAMKNKAVNSLIRIDPANAQKYGNILKNN